MLRLFIKILQSSALFVRKWFAIPWRNAFFNTSTIGAASPRLRPGNDPSLVVAYAFFFGHAYMQKASEIPRILMTFVFVSVIIIRYYSLLQCL